jgi:hypothetical protein
MHHSPCYRKTDSLTCTTCHNPHDPVEPAAKVDYYRQKCLSCHVEDGGCGLAESERLRQKPDNDCTACHMPQSGTEIPHLAFTHHRVGINHQTDYQEPQGPIELVSLFDASQIPDLDRERCLGLGYIHYGDKQGDPGRQACLETARYHLDRVHAAGLRDARVLGGLAYALWNQGSETCIPFAKHTLSSSDCEPETRVNSLLVLGDMQLRRGKPSEAKAAFLQLTRLRLNAVDWQMLGVCRAREGDTAGAIAAFQKAISLRRDWPELHLLLADAYSMANEPNQAQKAKEQAARLRRLLPN